MKKDINQNIIRFWLLIVIVINLCNRDLIAQSLDMDRRLGAQGAQEIAEQIGIYNNEKASNYVQTIGARLIDQLDNPLFEYNFFLVDMPEPNAFALPGGYIYLSRGLLCVANTEDELAGVIGHEIVHSQMRHSIQQMRKSIFPALLQLPGAIVGAVVNEDLGNLINVPLGVGSELLLSKYSRNHEREADELGIRIVADAGYDPKQLGVILENISLSMETITGKQEKFSYFDSHPFTPSRVKYINNEVKNIDINFQDPIAQTEEDFLQKIDGIYYWDNPEAGIFKGDTFIHPDLGLYFVVPEGWSTFNSPTYIGAADEENKRGMIYLGFADTNAAPEILGTEFATKLKDEHNTAPERNEKIIINGLDAYLVSVVDKTGTEPVGIHNLWFKLDNFTFQVLGASYESDYELLVKSANSLRALTEQEKRSVEVQVLRYATANDGESIEEFNKRTGNTWDPKLTAVMNNLLHNRPLNEGQLIKISRTEKYMQ
jgi:predicted Zn-dependent protease